jgi:hypothetical protein
MIRQSGVIAVVAFSIFLTNELCFPDSGKRNERLTRTSNSPHTLKPERIRDRIQILASNLTCSIWSLQQATNLDDPISRPPSSIES